MRLAFALDGYAGHAGALLRQAEPNGPIAVDAEADGDRAIVERQIRRILSLDHPGRDWIAVATRDPVIGRLQKEHPGLRPVLFHSPRACSG